jgi:hypothetical protein
MVLGKLDIHVKIGARPLSLTMYKNQFKMDQNLTARPNIFKLLEESKKAFVQAMIFWIEPKKHKETKANIDK